MGRQITIFQFFLKDKMKNSFKNQDDVAFPTFNHGF